MYHTIPHSLYETSPGLPLGMSLMLCLIGGVLLMLGILLVHRDNGTHKTISV